MFERYQTDKPKQGRKRSLTGNSDHGYEDISEMIQDGLWPNSLQYYLIPSDGDDIEGEEEFGNEKNSSKRMKTVKNKLSQCEGCSITATK